jgi:hypothetical protein
MKPTIVFDRAEIVRQSSGPEKVVLIGKDQAGKTHDFELELPRGAAESYVRELGFEGWFVREPGELKRQRTERRVEGQVESYVTSAGERTVLTVQSPEYDQEAAAAIESTRAGG